MIEIQNYCGKLHQHESWGHSYDDTQSSARYDGASDELTADAAAASVGASRCASALCVSVLSY